jgi:hypothetical protein
VLGDELRARRLLDLTGLTPAGLRAGVSDRATQRAVLEFLCAHEPDLVAASDALGLTPAELVAARDGLS